MKKTLQAAGLGLALATSAVQGCDTKPRAIETAAREGLGTGWEIALDEIDLVNCSVAKARADARKGVGEIFAECRDEVPLPDGLKKR